MEIINLWRDWLSTIFSEGRSPEEKIVTVASPSEDKQFPLFLYELNAWYISFISLRYDPNV